MNWKHNIHYLEREQCVSECDDTRSMTKGAWQKAHDIYDWYQERKWNYYPYTTHIQSAQCSVSTEVKLNLECWCFNMCERYAYSFLISKSLSMHNTPSFCYITKCTVLILQLKHLHLNYSKILYIFFPEMVRCAGKFIDLDKWLDILYGSLLIIYLTIFYCSMLSIFQTLM